VWVYTQCGVGVRDNQSVGSLGFGSFRSKSNVTNERRKLHPERPLGGLPSGSDYLGRQGWVGTKLGSPVVHIGAGDVQFIGREAFGILQDPNHLDVFANRSPKDIRYDRRVVPPELRKLLSDERAYADVLQPDCVHHSARRFAHSRRRSALHRLERESLDRNSAQAIQIDDLRKLDAVSERPACGNNWIFEVKGTDADSEVNPRGPFHDPRRLGRTHWR